MQIETPIEVKLTATPDIPQKSFPDIKLLIAPDNRLNTPSTNITLEELNDGSVINLVNTMNKVMRSLNGLGLSAIQVNVAKNLFIIDDYLGGETLGHKVFINPKLSDYQGNLEINEGCLSFPNLMVKVRRSEKITVEALDEKGNTFIINLEGLAAIAIQHEYDHLMGLTFLDKISKLKRDIYKKKYQKLRESRKTR